MNKKNKKFLVIGGAGLIGSHTFELLKENVKEGNIFNNFTRGREENLREALKDQRCKIYPIRGDILHTDILESAFEGIDGVLNFAAL